MYFYLSLFPLFSILFCGFLMAPDAGLVDDLCKENLVSLCEKFQSRRVRLSELLAHFVVFLRSRQEQELSTIHAEVMGCGGNV